MVWVTTRMFGVGEEGEKKNNGAFLLRKQSTFRDQICGCSMGGQGRRQAPTALGLHGYSAAVGWSHSLASQNSSVLWVVENYHRTRALTAPQPLHVFSFKPLPCGCHPTANLPPVTPLLPTLAPECLLPAPSPAGSSLIPGRELSLPLSGAERKKMESWDVCLL